MSQGFLTYHTQAGVAHLTFSHPAHNSMPAHLLQELTDRLEEAGRDDDVCCVLLRSGGERTFCAGANFDEMLAIENEPQGREFFSGFARVILAMRACPKPVVVAVQGKAIGGGVGIAAAADYCVATRAAAVRLSELAIAIGPFVILPAVERKLGTAATAELCWDTEWHDAEWAHQHGLYQRLFADFESLGTGVRALSEKIAGYSPAAAQRLKQALWRGTDDWPDLLMERAADTGRLVLSAETRAALESFKKKS